jgi:hypothetical protein
MDKEANDRFASENPTLYHILKMRRRQEARIVQKVQDSHRKSHAAPKGILSTFIEFMRQKYDNRVNEESFQLMAQVGNMTLPSHTNDSLDAPITLEELKLAVKKGQTRKSPGIDGICHDIFKATWETTKHDMLDILNEMS